MTTMPTDKRDTSTRGAVELWIATQITRTTTAQKKHAAVAMAVFILLNMNKIRTRGLPLLSAAIVAMGVASNSSQIATLVRTVKTLFNKMRSFLPQSNTVRVIAPAPAQPKVDLPALVKRMDELADQAQKIINKHDGILEKVGNDQTWVGRLETAAKNKLTKMVKPTYEALTTELRNPFNSDQEINTILACLKKHQQFLRECPKITSQLDFIIVSTEVSKLAKQAQAILESSTGTGPNTEVAKLLQEVYTSLYHTALGIADSTLTAEDAKALLLEYRPLFNHIPGAARKLDVILGDNPIFNMEAVAYEAQQLKEIRNKLESDGPGLNADMPKAKAFIPILISQKMQNINNSLTLAFKALTTIIQNQSRSAEDRAAAMACLKEHREILEEVPTIRDELKVLVSPLDCARVIRHMDTQANQAQIILECLNGTTQNLEAGADANTTALAQDNTMRQHIEADVGRIFTESKQQAKEALVPAYETLVSIVRNETGQYTTEEVAAATECLRTHRAILEDVLDMEQNSTLTDILGEEEDATAAAIPAQPLIKGQAFLYPQADSKSNLFLDSDSDSDSGRSSRATSDASIRSKNTADTTDTTDTTGSASSNDMNKGFQMKPLEEGNPFQQDDQYALGSDFEEGGDTWR